MESIDLKEDHEFRPDIRLDLAGYPAAVAAGELD